MASSVERERTAASVLVGAIDADAMRDIGAQPLIVTDRPRTLLDWAAARGLEPALWCRRAYDRAHPARAWPEAGPNDSALIRLPRSRAELDMTLWAAAGVLFPAAPVAVYGPNDEGIRSAAAHLEAIATGVTTIDVRRHCRVVAGRLRAGLDASRQRREAWRSTHEIELLGIRRMWTSYPGLFAHGRIDDGTALLLEALPELMPAARVLDLAAGTGLLAAGVLALAPAAQVDLVEIDALALAAAAENVPAAARHLGAGLAPVRGQRYDLIVSNPPFHAGKAEDRGVLDELVAEGPGLLRPKGRIAIVVQRRLGLAARLSRVLPQVERIAERGPYEVLLGRGR